MKSKGKIEIMTIFSIIVMLLGALYYYTKEEVFNPNRHENDTMDSVVNTTSSNFKPLVKNGTSDDYLRDTEYSDIKREPAVGEENETGNSKPFFQDVFTIYAIYDRYKPVTRTYFKDNGFKNYVIMSHSFIDPDGDNKINPERVEMFLSSRFPDKKKHEMCVINWEKKHLWSLKNYKPGDKKFDAAEAEFIKLLKLIKLKRPNLKVGIFGIPFRESHRVVKGFNQGNKFDKLLGYSDFITSSLYILYPDNEIGYENNEIFLERNLDIALGIAKKLNKPYIPFFWYRIHPKNPKYGLQIIPQEQMLRYLEKIVSHSHENLKVSGVFWWAPHTRQTDPRQIKKITNKTAAQNNRQNNEREIITQTYTKAFLKKILR
ncbi:hypothetical protein [Sinomicrobium oceani]|uniref:hypothetical protein n=1 Tax=Sinomicrobium oceani TaxID=1150368 RepID=UPI00227B50BE|nr:hypothetical protein [Sinomicrobium oceani]